MKTNLSRIISLSLALLMVVSVFVACKPDDTVTTTDVTNTDVVSVPDPVVIEVDEDAPYTISQTADGKDLVILTPTDDGSVAMTVAEKTTLADFLACVVAKDGYTIKITDKDGKEVTDGKTLLVSGMTFGVYADGEEEAKESFTIQVASAKEIEKTVAKQKELDKQAAQAGSTPGKKPVSSKPSSIVKKKKGADPNLDGQKMVINSIYAAAYTSSDATGKLWQSTFASLKSKHNCTTLVNSLDAESAADLLTKEVMAGKASADIYQVSLVMCRNLARKKVICNLRDSKTLDMSKFKNAGAESTTFGKHTYGVAISGAVINPMGITYNKDMVKKYCPQYDIEKLYKEKKWTFDAFRSVAKACTQDTNGDNHTDIYGFVSNTHVIGMALSSNAGGTAIMQNGKVVPAMCSDAGVTAMQWCKDMFKTDKSWNFKSDINDCIGEFVNGRAAMFVFYLNTYAYIAAQANFKYDFVLMPIGPDQKDYKNGLYDAAIYVVPKTKASKLNAIGAWLNQIANTSGKFLNIRIKDLARNGYGATTQGIVKWLANNMTAEFSSGAFSSEVANKVDGSIINPTSDPAKIMKSIQSQAQKELDDYYGDLY